MKASYWNEPETTALKMIKKCFVSQRDSSMVGNCTRRLSMFLFMTMVDWILAASPIITSDGPLNLDGTITSNGPLSLDVTITSDGQLSLDGTIT